MTAEYMNLNQTARGDSSLIWVHIGCHKCYLKYKQTIGADDSKRRQKILTGGLLM